MPSKLNEASLEELIATQMTSAPGWEPRWRPGDPANFNAAHCLDLPELAAFLIATQPGVAEAVNLGSGFNPAGSPTHLKFLTRLTTEVTNRGIVDVLRKGVGFNQHHVDLFFPTPSAANSKAAQLHAANRLAITRQVHYSVAQPGLSIDLVASVNGLPIATFEVKNLITHQNTDDAVRQYKRDRDPKEPLFKFGRCMAHFAVDDREVWFCAELKGKGSWFLPFNKGWKDGAGNPPNPDGVATDYLWRAVLAPSSLANIIENYAQVVTVKNLQTGAKVKSQIFPRYHQLDVVRKLLSDVVAQGSGHRYLIQHSAGSGKSNSIAWLAHQLMEAEHAGKRAFDSIIVVTDRVVLDGQIRDTIKNFMQVGSTVVHAESSSDLREAIEAGKKIIITTVQKFPYIVAGIGDDHRGKNFAIIIDEAHSSQGGKTAGALAEALSVAGAAGNEGVDVEDEINRLMEAKKMLPNASYFAFTATPKNKTLETFGEPYSEDGVVKHRPFHSYTMKQAIQEGFILDVLANYIPVAAYYKLVKTIDDDPEFDAKRASKKLRSYVEGQRDAIRLKAEIMVDHFQAQVIAKRKINGDARAMVVTASIDRAIKYYEAISAYLVETNSPYRAIVAFSDFERDGAKVTEAQYNKFPSAEIPSKIREDPYRILVCADKFQTGYDEPLLHTMYVDKPLSGVKAVQTLSRLNRATPGKFDTAVLDFFNDSDTIKEAFDDYYRTTLLADETDPNKLYDLEKVLRDSAVYAPEHVEAFVAGYLTNAPRDQLDPILDKCAAEYTETMDEDEQVAFKGSAKAFVRTYDFLSAILPFSKSEWEKLSIFLTFLIPKLPAPVMDDATAGLLETVDLDSYRAEKQAAIGIILEDEDAEIEPVPLGSGGGVSDPEMARLTEILRELEDRFGNIPWEDKDRIHRMVTHDIPEKVAENEAYQLAQQNNDAANARIEMERALTLVMLGLMSDQTQLFKQFSDNADFKKWLSNTVFDQTYLKAS